MHITMVGTGYVGLVTGACLANTGNDVTCLDIDADKIAKLKQGQSPIYEPGLEELLRRNVKGNRLHFTTDKATAYQQAEMIFICVGTPSDEQGRADLRYVLAAARDLGQAIQADERYAGAEDLKIVVIKSTVPVGTNAKVKAAIASQTSKPFAMASNPEFLKEGAALADFNKPDRVVIGCEDKATGERLRDLYEPFVRQGNPIFLMDIPSAEMVKYAANAMLATKISFINEMANLCEVYGADIDEVRRGMCSDRRIGNQFLYPGLGYGGSCFPKDVLACISMGLEAQTPTALLAAVHDVNQRQRATFTQKILRHMGVADPAQGDPGQRPLQGRRVAVWGIAFKPGTDDIREAPSITLMGRLLESGASVVAYDPAAAEPCLRLFANRIACVANPMEALDQADALVICTDWDEFRHPDLDDMKRRMKKPVVFDGRNLYRPQAMREAGFTYFSVGREAVAQP